MIMKTVTVTVAAAVAIAIAVAPAVAQIGQADSPIEITSQSSEYLQKEGRVVYFGNVRAVQSSSAVTTDKLTAVCSRAESGECEQIRMMIAEGNVLYLAPEVRIRGDRAEYDYDTDTITITGNVLSSRGEEAMVQGKKIVYNVGEGRVVVTAGSDRVTSIFNTTKKPAAAPPATPPATPPAQPAPSRSN